MVALSGLSRGVWPIAPASSSRLLEFWFQGLGMRFRVLSREATEQQ